MKVENELTVNPGDLPEGMKTVLINSTCESSSKHLIAIMELLKIENFIECTIVDDRSGNKYQLSFKRVKNL